MVRGVVGGVVVVVVVVVVGGLVVVVDLDNRFLKRVLVCNRFHQGNLKVVVEVVVVVVGTSSSATFLRLSPLKVTLARVKYFLVSLLLNFS